MPLGRFRHPRSTAPQKHRGRRRVSERRMTARPPIRGFRQSLHPRLSHVFPPCGKHPKKSSRKESSLHQPNTDSGDSRSGTKPLPAKAQNAGKRVAKTTLCCAPSEHMRRRVVARYMRPRQRRIRVGAKGSGVRGVSEKSLLEQSHQGLGSRASSRHVRRRCTTWDNRGCRLCRNPRTRPATISAAKQPQFVPDAPAALWNRPQKSVPANSAGTPL